MSASASASIASRGRGVDAPRSGDRRSEHLDAVVVLAEILDLARRAVGLGIALEVAVEPVHLALEERRSAAFAGAGNDLTRRLVDREEVGPVPR